MEDQETRQKREGGRGGREENARVSRLLRPGREGGREAGALVPQHHPNPCKLLPACWESLHCSRSPAILGRSLSP